MLLRMANVAIRFLLALLSLLFDRLVLLLSLLLQVKPHEELEEVQVFEISGGERELSNNNLNVLLLKLQFQKHFSEIFF